MSQRFLLHRLVRKVALTLARAARTSEADEMDVWSAYWLLLGRDPDPIGLPYWRRAVQANPSRRQLVEGLLNSPEFRGRHTIATASKVDASDFVIYVDRSDQLVGAPIAKARTWEPHVTAVIEAELRPDMTFLDIGANIGWFTLLAAKRLTNGSVIAVEPYAVNLQLIYKSLLANQLTNVTVFPFAATDVSRILPFGHDGSDGHVLANTGFSENNDYVPGARLDDFLAHQPRVDIVKIDVEGHELSALRGLQQTLTRCRPLLLTEFNVLALRNHGPGQPQAYWQFLVDLGYHLTMLDAQGREQPVADFEQLMDIWTRTNQRRGYSDGRLHLDLVGRMEHHARE